MNKPEKKATFIATVRIDIKDLAKLARFLSNRNIYVGSRSKVASEALRIMAKGTPDGQDIITARQAVLELEELGYGETLDQDKRYHNTLFNEIKVEETAKLKQSVTEQAAAEYMQAKQEQAKQEQAITEANINQIIDAPNSPLASPANLADIDQKSSNEAKQMRASLDSLPSAETEGGEQDGR